MKKKNVTTEIVQHGHETIRYTIDSAKRQVACLIYPDVSCPGGLANKISRRLPSKRNHFIPEIEIWVSEYYVGVAKCHPEDTFDVEIGKKVAMQKARFKQYAETMEIIHNLKMDLELKRDALVAFAANEKAKMLAMSERVKEAIV